MDDHSTFMAKPSNREKLLTEGMRVVHEHGFGASSVRDIVQAAGVPQGSFTNHFASKEAFALEVIDLYFAATSERVKNTLRNDALPPLERLRKYFASQLKALKQNDMRNGCLYGNFSAEASDHSELIRRRVIDIFAQNQESLAYCLRAAVAAGELPADSNVEEIAGFVQSSLQGAILMAKAQRSPLPIERLERVLFSSVLRPTDA
jgi:TetR/AcrR family transcriptional repressor of nem operon